MDRWRGRWMNDATDPVLQILRLSGDWRSPSDIIVNMQQCAKETPSRATVYRALDDLTSYEYTGDGDYGTSTLVRAREFEGYGTYYQLTGLGRAYLEGEIDGGAFEEPE